jgi:hypothetical protein
MSNWYKSIDINIKNNIDPNKIVDLLKQEFIIEGLNIKIDTKSISIEGEEGDKFNDKNNNHYLADVENIFSTISKNFPDCTYDATVEKENSYSTETEDYYITADNNTLKIGTLPIATEIGLYEYNNYEDFTYYWEDILSEEEFNNLKKDKIDYIFKLEDNSILSEKEYYNSKDYYFNKNINNL